MKKEPEEVIAEILSPGGRTWKVLEYSGAPRGELLILGEYSVFQSTLQKAVTSGYVLVWCADNRLSRDWKSGSTVTVTGSQFDDSQEAPDDSREAYDQEALDDSSQEAPNDSQEAPDQEAHDDGHEAPDDSQEYLL